MKPPKDGPTARILRLARAAPGGVIRWHEARDEYLKGSASARTDEARASRSMHRGFSRTSSSGGRGFHMSLSRLLDRHFYPVDKLRGYYVLKGVVFNDDYYEDKQVLATFRAAYGLDDNGMSISHPRYTIGVIDGRATAGMFDQP